MIDVDVDVDGDGDGNLVVTFDDGARLLVRNRPPSGADLHGMLSFQRLDVYQRAIEFLSLAIDIVDDLPRGHAARSDQLIRAAESVVRNIAEGAGRWSQPDGSKHYKIARGEAMESAASLDVLKLRKLVNPEKYERASSCWRASSPC